MNVIAIDIKDFKRIRLFRAKITKEQGLILIGGNNGQGKSSVLDALLVALNPGSLAGIKAPIREGAEEAQIAITVGPYRIVRRIRQGAKSGGLTIYRDGQAQDRPTDLLRELLGELFVDPMKWMNAEPIEQRRILAKIVGLDFAEIDAKLAELKQREKFLDEQQSKLEHQAEALESHPDAPAEPISAADVAAEIQAAIEHNSTGSRLTAAADSVRVEIDQATRQVVNAQIEIERLERALSEARQNKIHMEAKVDDATKREATLRESAAQVTLIDLAPLNEKLASIEEINRKVNANIAKETARATWKAAEAELGKCIEERSILEGRKKKMLAEAHFPVEGLSFDAHGVLFNGQPLNSNGSQAEQIRVAIAVSLAQRGQCAPLIVRAGNDLDNHSMELLAQEAERHGSQIFVEIVANRNDEGGYDKEADFYVEEGELVGYQNPQSTLPEGEERAS